jgi:hypothetical protein
VWLRPAGPPSRVAFFLELKLQQNLLLALWN